jgi:glycosyltransferase involved in cell wall biosynthesis
MAMNAPVFTVFMPVYNDEKWIKISIESLLVQGYTHWQLIIINDGSTDGTAEVVKSFLPHPQIVYLEQENQDQNRAIENGMNYAEGTHYMLLHSDDMFLPDALEHLAQHFQDDKDLMGVYADLVRMNAEGENQGYYKSYNGLLRNYIKAVLLAHGFNLIGDHFCLAKRAFLAYCYPNYVQHATIYAIDYNRLSTLSLKRVEPWYAYRVFEENYIHSEVGYFVTQRGCFRTIANLFKSGASFSAFLFTHPLGRKLLNYFTKHHLNILSYVSLRQEDQVNYSLALRYYERWKKGLLKRSAYASLLFFLDRILHSLHAAKGCAFAKPFKMSQTHEPGFRGQDERTFFKLYQSQQIPNLHYRLLTEDYDHIVVHSDEEERFTAEFLHFHALFYPVKRQFSPPEHLFKA